MKIQTTDLRQTARKMSPLPAARRQRPLSCFPVVAGVVLASGFSVSCPCSHPRATIRDDLSPCFDFLISQDLNLSV